MKVLPVSISFTSGKIVDNYDNNFLYNKPLKQKQDNNKLLKQYTLATAAIAVSAVMIALYNLGSKQKFHRNIVEVPNLSNGLNKIKEHDDVIDLIKSQFIYPIKAADLGDNKIVKSKKYKTGLIITGDDKYVLRKINDALKEHFDKLEIDTVVLKQPLHAEKDGHQYTRRLLKKELINKFYTEVEKAKEKYKQTGKYTVISLGKFEDFTRLRIAKPNHSKTDELITQITPKNSPGVIWFAWTTESTSLPIYLSNLPVLIAKA